MDPCSGAQDIMRCDLCDTTAVHMHCETCLTNLCKSCVGDHISMEESMDHKVVRYQSRKSGSLYMSCASHRARRCGVYCSHCDKPVCSVCLASGDHTGHTVSQLLDVFNSRRGSILKENRDLEDDILPTYEQEALEAKSRMSLLENQHRDRLAYISEHGLKFHKEVENVVTDLKRRVSEAKRQQLETLEKHLAEIYQTISLIRQTVSENAEMLESLELSKSFQQENMNEFKLPPPKYCPSLPQFKPNQIGIEQLSMLFGTLSKTPYNDIITETPTTGATDNSPSTENEYISDLEDPINEPKTTEHHFFNQKHGEAEEHVTDMTESDHEPEVYVPNYRIMNKTKKEIRAPGPSPKLPEADPAPNTRSKLPEVDSAPNTRPKLPEADTAPNTRPKLPETDTAPNTCPKLPKAQSVPPVVKEPHNRDPSQTSLKSVNSSVENFFVEPIILGTMDTDYSMLYNVTGLSCEEIWTSGNGRFMKLYSISQGLLLKKVRTESKNTPTDIAVTSNGDLVYTDGERKTINVLKRDTIEEMIRLKNWKPLNIYSASSGDLLVTMHSDDYKQAKVVRYSGSEEKQTVQFDERGRALYSCNSKIKYVTENENLDICVADQGAKTVVVVNHAGKLKFTYTGHTPAPKNKSYRPYGIATDSRGNILTADDYNQCVHVIDRNGKFLAYIECGLRYPWGLYVDTNDNLLVAEDTKVAKIRYLN